MIALLLAAVLATSPANGSLRVRTDVSGVKVLIGDQEAGETPATLDVPAGRHRLTLVKPGFLDHVEDVDIKDGATTRLFIVMKPVEVPLPAFPVEYRVLHQHRSGACAGILTLTADGISYKADDGGDVFMLPLKEIKSVARSPGSVPFGLGLVTDLAIASRMKAKIIPARIEAPGRSYGFWARGEDLTQRDPDLLDEAAARDTKQLFEILYRLWTRSVSK